MERQISYLYFVNQVKYRNIWILLKAQRVQHKVINLFLINDFDHMFFIIYILFIWYIIYLIQLIFQYIYIFRIINWDYKFINFVVELKIFHHKLLRDDHNITQKFWKFLNISNKYGHGILYITCVDNLNFFEFLLHNLDTF